MPSHHATTHPILQAAWLSLIARRTVACMRYIQVEIKNLMLNACSFVFEWRHFKR
jgi:hypothetical protein